MPAGVRIESINLSGKTVTVTFNPASGGEPIDLGTKIVPFDYMTADPYGTYDLFVIELQTTYSITVNT